LRHVIITGYIELKLYFAAGHNGIILVPNSIKVSQLINPSDTNVIYIYMTLVA